MSHGTKKLWTPGALLLKIIDQLCDGSAHKNTYIHSKLDRGKVYNINSVFSWVNIDV